MLKTCLVAFILGLLLAQVAAAKRPACRHVSQMVQAHFMRHGVRLPTHAYTKALSEAAIDVSHLNCHSSTLVIVAMANEEALNLTVPLFLRSLKRVKVSGGKNAGETFDARLVVVAWSLDSLKMCHALQGNFSHHCVRDAQHFPGKESFGFHSDSFHALGFAKVKYILNGLSAGHDVLFLDADIQLLRDPVPYIYQRSGDMFVMVEKCVLCNVSQPLTFRRSQPDTWIPPINIGALYFKATAAVTRCVYNWIWDMYGQVPLRAHVWDQDIFGLLMPRCAGKLGVKLHVLDPRLFQSGCFPRCGCAFNDSDVTPESTGSAVNGVPPVKEHLCDPGGWDSWVLRHYACSGGTNRKAYFMHQFENGLLNGSLADITRTWIDENQE